MKTNIHLGQWKDWWINFPDWLKIEAGIYNQLFTQIAENNNPSWVDYILNLLWNNWFDLPLNEWFDHLKSQIHTNLWSVDIRLKKALYETRFWCNSILKNSSFEITENNIIWSLIISTISNTECIIDECWTISINWSQNKWRSFINQIVKKCFEQQKWNEILWLAIAVNKLEPKNDDFQLLWILCLIEKWDIEMAKKRLRTYFIYEEEWELDDIWSYLIDTIKPWLIFVNINRNYINILEGNDISIELKWKSLLQDARIVEIDYQEALKITSNNSKDFPNIVELFKPISDSKGYCIFKYERLKLLSELKALRDLFNSSKKEQKTETSSTPLPPIKKLDTQKEKYAIPIITYIPYRKDNMSSLFWTTLSEEDIKTTIFRWKNMAIWQRIMDFIVDSPNWIISKEFELRSGITESNLEKAVIKHKMKWVVKLQQNWSMITYVHDSLYKRFWINLDEFPLEFVEETLWISEDDLDDCIARWVVFLIEKNETSFINNKWLQNLESFIKSRTKLVSKLESGFKSWKIYTFTEIARNWLNPWIFYQLYKDDYLARWIQNWEPWITWDSILWMLNNIETKNILALSLYQPNSNFMSEDDIKILLQSDEHIANETITELKQSWKAIILRWDTQELALIEIPILLWTLKQKWYKNIEELLESNYRLIQPVFDKIPRSAIPIIQNFYWIKTKFDHTLWLNWITLPQIIAILNITSCWNYKDLIINGKDISTKELDKKLIEARPIDDELQKIFAKILQEREKTIFGIDQALSELPDFNIKFNPQQMLSIRKMVWKAWENFWVAETEYDEKLMKKFIELEKFITWIAKIQQEQAEKEASETQQSIWSITMNSALTNLQVQEITWLNESYVTNIIFSILQEEGKLIRIYKKKWKWNIAFIKISDLYDFLRSDKKPEALEKLDTIIVQDNIPPIDENEHQDNILGSILAFKKVLDPLEKKTWLLYQEIVSILPFMNEDGYIYATSKWKKIYLNEIQSIHQLMSNIQEKIDDLIKTYIERCDDRIKKIIKLTDEIPKNISTPNEASILTTNKSLKNTKKSEILTQQILTDLNQTIQEFTSVIKNMAFAISIFNDTKKPKTFKELENLTKYTLIEINKIISQFNLVISNINNRIEEIIKLNENTNTVPNVEPIKNSHELSFDFENNYQLAKSISSPLQELIDLWVPVEERIWKEKNQAIQEFLWTMNKLYLYIQETENLLENIKLGLITIKNYKEIHTQITVIESGVNKLKKYWIFLDQKKENWIKKLEKIKRKLSNFEKNRLRLHEQINLELFKLPDPNEIMPENYHRILIDLEFIDWLFSQIKNFKQYESSFDQEWMRRYKILKMKLEDHKKSTQITPTTSISSSVFWENIHIQNANSRLDEIKEGDLIRLEQIEFWWVPIEERAVVPRKWNKSYQKWEISNWKSIHRRTGIEILDTDIAWEILEEFIDKYPILYWIFNKKRDWSKPIQVNKDNLKIEVKRLDIQIKQNNEPQQIWLEEKIENARKAINLAKQHWSTDLNFSRPWILRLQSAERLIEKLHQQ